MTSHESPFSFHLASEAGSSLLFLQLEPMGCFVLFCFFFKAKFFQEALKKPTSVIPGVPDRKGK